MIKITLILSIFLFISCGQQANDQSEESTDIWQYQSTEISNDLQDLHFYDTTSGWIAGRDGLLMNSSDSGRSWQSGGPPRHCWHCSRS
jgi:photosystem II stability/assembly factor-like uncharacterized protein